MQNFQGLRMDHVVGNMQMEIIGVFMGGDSALMSGEAEDVGKFTLNVPEIVFRQRFPLLKRDDEMVGFVPLGAGVLRLSGLYFMNRQIKIIQCIAGETIRHPESVQFFIIITSSREILCKIFEPPGF